MAAILIRNLPAATHHALKQRARHYGCRMEAEARAILAQAVQKEIPVRLGSALNALARPGGGFNLKLKRDSTPTRGAELS